MPDPFGVSSGGGHGRSAPVRREDFFRDALAKTPPGLALLAKEQAAEARQAAGKNPGVTPAAIWHGIVHNVKQTINPPPNYVIYKGKREPVQGAPIFNPVTLGLDQLAHLPSLIRHARETGAQIGRASKGEGPLPSTLDIIMSGAIGFPRAGVKFEGPEGSLPIHPRATPKVQDVKTLGATTTGALQGARGLRTSQESLRNAERGSRAREYAKSLQANPTIEGHREASQLLSGELPKLRFGGFENFTPEALAAMVKHVADHPMLRPFEQKRTIDALGKIHGGTVPTKSEEKLLRLTFGDDTTKSLMQSVSKFHQLKAIGYDIGNLPRSVMASFDASGILRQALLIATGHPKIWAKNVPEYFKAIKSEQVYDKGMAALHARPNAVNGVYEKMGVELTEMTPRGSAAAREESFRSPLAEKIPGVRMSGRGFTLFLDNARADLADHMYAKALRQGRDLEDPHLLESIGDVVNSSSGRGDLGQGVIGRSQEGLNLLLFSPRLIKSRVDFINPVWYAKLDPLARHEAYKAMSGLVVLMATALSIGKAAGAAVNLDPRSSDFAKIKVGNTRLDFGGGFLQYMRLMSTIATQQTVSTSGKVTDLGKQGPGNTSDWDVVFRFMRSKLAPLASLSVDVSQRQNTIGQPLTWQNTLLARFTPLSGQDALSVGRDAADSLHSPYAGVAAGLGAFGLSAIGGGVQNFQPKKPKPARDTDPFNVSGGSRGNDPFNVGR